MRFVMICVSFLSLFLFSGASAAQAAAAAARRTASST
jgi:hypothetical protein